MKPAQNNVLLELHVPDFEITKEYYEKIKDSVNVFEPLKLRPWGLKDFRCVDPFGYYLRITTPHNILDSSNAVK